MVVKMSNKDNTMTELANIQESLEHALNRYNGFVISGPAVQKVGEALNDRLLDYLSDNATVEKIDGCWNWTGTLNNGYPSGSKTIKGKIYRAHQIAAIVGTGRLPVGKEQASHLCNNKMCVSPKHVVLESQSANLKRSSDVLSEAARKRYEDTAERAKQSERLRNSAKHKEANRSRSHCKLTMADAREIRRRYSTGNYSMRALAKMYGCSKGHICRIINNKIWRED